MASLRFVPSRPGILLLVSLLAVLVPSVGAGADTGQAVYLAARADRSGAVHLDGRSVSGDVFAFVANSANAADVSGIKKVAFYLDGRHQRNEELKPFDLAGGSTSLAAPFSTAGLAAGAHTLKATVTSSNGSSRTLTSTFTVGTAAAPSPTTTTTTTTTVAPTAPVLTGQRLYLAPRADRSSAADLAGATVSGDVFVFFARSSDAGDVSGIKKVAFYLDGRHQRNEELEPFDLAGGSTSLAAPFSTGGLAAGDHTLKASVTYSNGSTSTFSSTFTVGTTAAPAPDPVVEPEPVVEPAPVVDPIVDQVLSKVPTFSPGSFWYQKLPADAPLHAQSAGMVADFERQWRTFYNNVGINTTTYAPPIFVAGPDAPRQTIRFWNCQNKTWLDPKWSEQMVDVPIPSTMQPSAGTDGELVIHQPSTDTIWELWKARKAADGVWEACWGGRLTNASTSQGVFPRPYGTTATGLSLAGGIITPEELAAGRIDHALAISLVQPKRTVFSWPANRTDGFSDLADAIPEGLRLRLDPSIDVDSLDITRTAKIVAKALQTYGMIVRDKSGSVTFYAENIVAEGGTDPYPALFEGKPRYSVLNGIPWHRLQALPMDYGKP